MNKLDNAYELTYEDRLLLEVVLSSVRDVMVQQEDFFWSEHSLDLLLNQDEMTKLDQMLTVLKENNA